jgi:trehalose 6-phosphate synthase/phosphatase
LHYEFAYVTFDPSFVVEIGLIMKVKTNNPLLVGMNRLPFEITATKTPEGTFAITLKDSPGGLASALEPLREAYKAVYIGWIGKNNIPLDEQTAITEFCNQQTIIPVFLSEEECQLYYGDFANRELWPIFHDLMDMRSPASLDHKTQAWEMYKAVNKKFATAYVNFILENEIKEPRIWLHDYHLLTCAQEIVIQLLAKGYLRKDINLGFFSHIPTPLPQNFLKLNDIAPEIAHSLIAGLISNDYCGFQTHENARRLAEIAKTLGFTVKSLPDSQYEISTGANRCIIGANPISINPTPWFNNSDKTEYDRYISLYFHKTSALLNSYTDTSPLLNAQSKKLFLSQIDAIHTDIINGSAETLAPESTVFDGHRKLIISVQRADYTKGMPEQLDAYQKFLEANTEHKDKVSFIFVAVPSRSGLDEFDQTFKIVVDKIQAMRAQYGTEVIQFSSGFDKFRLARLYRKADVIWVNSLADGMNLVAKEAVICQTEESPGQLLIGKGAGAAEALYLDGQGAYVIDDPRNIQATALMLAQALDTPKEQAVIRMKNMQKEIQMHNIDHYAQGFINDQTQAHKHCHASQAPVVASWLSSISLGRPRTQSLPTDNPQVTSKCNLI